MASISGLIPAGLNSPEAQLAEPLARPGASQCDAPFMGGQTAAEGAIGRTAALAVLGANPVGV